MKTPNLKRSIAVIVILSALVILQHVFRAYNTNVMVIPVSLNISVLVFVWFYFIQLSRNLNYFLSITTIKNKILQITISYTLMYIFLIYSVFFVGHGLNKMAENTIIFSVLLLISVAATINMLAQSCILGHRLIKSNSSVFIKRLGFTFLYLTPVAFTITLLLLVFKSLKNYSHIFIIIELLPYWFTYQLYRELMAQKDLQKDGISFITNAPLETNPDEHFIKDL